MKSSLIFICIAFFISPLFSQTILNGSFETNTATSSMDNLSNATLSQTISNVYGFGDFGQIDFYKGDSWVTWPVPYSKDGEWRIGLGTNTNTKKADAFAFKLSAPLEAGKTYYLSYYDIARSGNPTGGQVEIGISSNSSSFGTSVYKSPTAVVNVWTLRSFSFTATSSAQYITVRAVVGTSGYGYQWTFVDNFVLSKSTDIPIFDNSDIITASPNPSFGILSLQYDNQSVNCYIEIYDLFGNKVFTIDSFNKIQYLDLQSLKEGLYFIKIIDGAIIYTEKIIIQ